MAQPFSRKVDILSALSGSELIGNQEHAWMDPELAAAGGVAEGDQVRVRRDSSNYALYTVSQLYQDGTDDDDMRMAQAAREKLGTTSTMTNIDAYKPEDSVLTGKTESWLSSNDEYGEFLDDDGSQADFVVCAPHGGSIEAGTDEQAERCYDQMVNTHGKNCTAWRAKGFKSGGGAFDRWHITSTDISPNSFTLLGQIQSRGFAYAVSFHGFSSTGVHVKVGGGASDTLKQEVADAIADALPGSATVEVLGENEPLNGDDPDNFVNWLTASGDTGVQLEQSADARNSYGDAIADAVAEVFAAKI